MKRKIFYILSFFVILVVSIITILSVLLYDLKYYTELTFGLIEKRTGLRVTMDDVTIAFFRGAGIKMDNLLISDPETGEHILQSKRVYILTEIAPLLKKDFIITKLFFQDPEVTLSLHTGNKLFFSTIPVAQLQPMKTPESSDISLQLKNLVIHNGTLDFIDKHLSETTRIERITLSAEQNRADRYDVRFSAEPVLSGETGSVSLDGEICFQDAYTTLHGLTARGSLVFENIRIQPYLPYLTDTPGTIGDDAVLNGTVHFSKPGGMEFKSAGHIQSDNFSFTTDQTGTVHITPLDIHFETIFRESTLLIEHFEANFRDKIMLTGKAEITPAPLSIDMKLSSSIMDINTLKPYITPALENHQQIQDFLLKTTSGNIQIKEVIYTGSFDREPSQFNLFTLIDDVAVDVDPGLPPLEISDGFLNLSKNRMDIYLASEILGQDSHRIKASVISPFDAPELKADIDSIIPARRLLNTLSGFQQKNASPFAGIETSGEITAQTHLHFAPELGKGGHLSSAIDFSHVRFDAKGVISKDQNVPLKLFLEKHFTSEAPDSPVKFELRSSDYFSFTGTLTSFSPVAAQGHYRIREFPLSLFSYPLIPSEFAADGFLSGDGNFSYPFNATSVLPFVGTLFIKDFSMLDTETEETFAQTNMGLEIAPDRISITRSYAEFGKTSLFLEGTLSAITPVEGDITITGKHIDIENFIDTINNINDRIPEEDRQGRSREFFSTLNIRSDIRTPSVSFDTWKGGNAWSDFTFNDGVLLWDNIHISTDDGFLNGSIMYDFSDQTHQLLRFIITDTDVDIAWAVPGLKKEETMTGRLKLAGRIQSGFPKGARIMPRMNGNLNILVSEGKLLRFTVLSKILSLINLPQFFQMDIPDPLSKGMPFESITTDLKIKQGVLTTENFLLKSPAMHMSAVGSIDTVKDTIDLTAGVQILPAITKLIGHIPIAGNIITDDRGTITIAYFQISGDLYNPNVKPKPLKSINSVVRRTLTNIFTLPGRIFLPLFRDNDDKNNNATLKETE